MHLSGRISERSRPRTKKRGVLPEPGGRLLRVPGERVDGSAAAPRTVQTMRQPRRLLPRHGRATRQVEVYRYHLSRKFPREKTIPFLPLLPSFV